MPTQQRPRSHQARAVRAARQVADRCREQDTINRAKPWPRDLAAQDLELVAQDEQLDVLDVPTAATADERAQQRPEREIQERDCQGRRSSQAARARRDTSIGTLQVHTQRDDPVPDGSVDHLWIRVRDPAASKRFYTTIAPYAGLELGVDEPDHVQFEGAGHSFSLIDDERPLTEHVHVAFPAQDDATVRAFHAAALAAGYEDHGGPGERAVYHPGYYGAFVLDPDGHNVEVVNHNP
jgi:catechol 2,3-dioxygenase-like lactoylglutathione lyase family enzyme